MRGSVSKRRVLWTAVLFGLWMMLSRSLDPLHLAVGLLAAAAVVMLNTSVTAPGSATARLRAAAAYAPWLLGRIIASGLRLSFRILHPGLPIRPRLFQHGTELDSEEAMMLMSGSITLTPGTVTVDASGSDLTVHTVDDDFTGDLSSGLLEAKVASVFRAKGADA